MFYVKLLCVPDARGDGIFCHQGQGGIGLDDGEEDDGEEDVLVAIMVVGPWWMATVVNH